MATTQILPFCTEAAGSGGNRLSPTAYAALTTLLATGFQSGTANSAQANTALAQATFMAAGLAGFCVANGISVPDDGNLSNLVTEIGEAIAAAATAAVGPPIGALSYSGLAGAWVSNTSATWTANQLVLQNSSYVPVLLTSYNKTLNTGTSGAGGLDTGSIANSTWYYVFAIWNGTTQNILMSLSATAPTLPSGYTYFARISSIYIDSSSHVRSFSQYGHAIELLSNVSVLSSGTATTPTSVSLASAIPPTAGRVYAVCTSGVVSVSIGMFLFRDSGGSVVLVTTYGNGTNTQWTAIAFIPVAGVVYYDVSSGSGAGAISVTGYDDNL